MRRILSRLIILSFLIGLIGAGVFAWGYGQYVKPGPTLTENTVIIPRGRGVEGIANTLAQAGIIREALIFRLGVRVGGTDKSLKAGEYIFPAKVSPQRVAEILTIGKTVVRRLTIAEGLTTQQVLQQILATDGLEGDVDVSFKEGQLLPETYHFSYGDRRNDLALRMADSMTQTVARLWQGRAKGLPLKTQEEALVLASIVEKETAVAGERPRVAGVFINRLRTKMRLQSDPTVVYGLTGGAGPLGRPLSRADLKQKTPYNTYQISRLPPTPIANPGIAAIAAVLNPEQTLDFYFVADGTGGHVFARTLKEHNRNVAKWRKFRASQAQ